MASPSVIRYDKPDADDLRRLAAAAGAGDASPGPTDELSRVIVQKPWGYEYELTRTETASAWVLFIRSGASTSLHCHERKSTSLTVLAGDVQCQLLGRSHRRVSGQSITFGPGVFHRTTAVSAAGAFVLEVESPVDKFDLVRISDDYGRVNQGYENRSHWSTRMWNSNHHSFTLGVGYYNSTKHFPDTTVSLIRWQNIGELREQIREDDTLVLLHATGLQKPESGTWDAGLVLTGKEILSGHEPSGMGVGLLIREADQRARYAECMVQEFLRLDVRDFYFVPSTTNTHLIDAIAQAPTAHWVVLQTELAAVQAAEAHAKMTGRACVAVVGAGASATGIITGLAGAYVDSAPVIVVSCRSRLSSWRRDDGGPRQLANKDIDVVSIARPVTKKAWTVENIDEGASTICQALAIAAEDRRWPALIDFPIDFLGARVERKTVGLDQPMIQFRAGTASPSPGSVADVVSMLREAKRPVMLVGHGVRAAGAEARLRAFIDRTALPVLLTRRSVDLLEFEHPLCFGCPGTYGQRRANFVLQNCDLLLAIGARLSLPLTGRNREAFTRAARRVVVDVDPQELSKTNLHVDLPICCDANAFLEKLDAGIPSSGIRWDAWLARCTKWRQEFPPEGGLSASGRGGVDPYWFAARLAEAAAETAAIVCDGGPATDFIVQSFAFRGSQRLITSAGLEARGFALAGAIGVSVADRDRPVFCVMETRGLQIALAELHTLAAHGIPVKVFVFNGLGDIATRAVQSRYFGQRFVGFEHELVGQAFDVRKVVAGFGIPAERWIDSDAVAARLTSFLEQPGPGLAEIVLPVGHESRPRMGLTVTEDGRWTSRPLEDMEPLLTRDLLEASMIVPLWSERN